MGQTLNELIEMYNNTQYWGESEPELLTLIDLLLVERTKLNDDLKKIALDRYCFRKSTEKLVEKCDYYKKELILANEQVSNLKNLRNSMHEEDTIWLEEV